METKRYLGIDIGSTTFKAVLLGEDGKVERVRARRLRAPELVGEMAEVRGEERWQDVELHHSMFLMILPLTVLGSSSRKTTIRGYL